MSALANEIAGLKYRLKNLEDQVASSGRLSVTVAALNECSDLAEERRQLVAWASIALRLRRKRDRIFDGLDLFGEPAWDILLELVLASAADRRMSVNEASIASAVPATTALRYIKHLDNAGLISASDDPLDGRRRWLELSPLGSSLMQETLSC